MTDRACTFLNISVIQRAESADSLQVRTIKDSLIQIGGRQVGIRQDRVAQIGGTEVSTGEVGSREISTGKASSREVSHVEIRACQLCFAQVSVPEVAIREIAATQVGPKKPRWLPVDEDILAWGRRTGGQRNIIDMGKLCDFVFDVPLSHYDFILVCQRFYPFAIGCFPGLPGLVDGL